MASGLNDSDPGVRDLAYIALVKVEMLNKDVANKYIPSLKKTRKEKYDSLKKEELRRIQKGEMYTVDSGDNNSKDSNESKAMNSMQKHKVGKPSTWWGAQLHGSCSNTGWGAQTQAIPNSKERTVPCLAPTLHPSGWPFGFRVWPASWTGHHVLAVRRSICDSFSCKI